MDIERLKKLNESEDKVEFKEVKILIHISYTGGNTNSQKVVVAVPAKAVKNIRNIS